MQTENETGAAEPVPEVSQTQPARSSGLFLAAIVGDLVLLAVAWLIYQQGHRPLRDYEVAGLALCTGFGAWLSVWPFVLRERAAQAREARADLADAVSQIQRIEEVAERIKTATGQWQTAQEHAAGAVAAARDIANRMAAEQKEFQTFIEQANKAEQQHLQLEANKLRRAEGDWLQAAVRVMDHVYALYGAALRSGQPALADQIGRFQEACREATRRLGFVPLTAAPGVVFDPNLHQLLDPKAEAPAGARVGGTIATGYSYQGQLLRPVVVALETPAAGTPVSEATSMAFSSAAPEALLSPEVADEALVDSTPPPAPPATGETTSMSFGDGAQPDLPLTPA